MEFKNISCAKPYFKNNTVMTRDQHLEKAHKQIYVCTLPPHHPENDYR